MRAQLPDLSAIAAEQLVGMLVPVPAREAAGEVLAADPELTKHAALGHIVTRMRQTSHRE